MILIVELKDGQMIVEEVRTVKKKEYQIEYYRKSYYSGESNSIACESIKTAKVLSEGKEIVIYTSND